MEHVNSFTEDYKNAEIIRLEQNYRSTNIILNAANALIDNNKDRLGKNLWTDKLEGEQIILYQAYNEQDEARFVADVLKDNFIENVKSINIDQENPEEILELIAINPLKKDKDYSITLLFNKNRIINIRIFV